MENNTFQNQGNGDGDKTSNKKPFPSYNLDSFLNFAKSNNKEYKEPSSTYIDKVTGYEEPTYVVPRNVDEQQILKQINYQRGENQGVLAEVGNMVIGGLAKVPFTVVGNVASFLDYEDYHNQDKEVGNWVTQWMENIKGDIEESTKIYRSNDNTLSSREWWLTNGKGLIDSATAFAITAAIPGAAFSKGLGLLKALGASEAVLGGAKIASNIANATLLNQAEGISVAMDVYKQAYNFKLQELNTDIELGKLTQQEADDLAQQTAADAAAYSININRINIPLNLTSTGAFIRTPAMTRQIAKDMSKKAILKRLAAEGTQEYAEEDVNMIATNEALLSAKQGENYSYNFDRTVNDVLSKEGFEQGIVGFIGGLGQTFISQNVYDKLKKDAPSYDEDGNVQFDSEGNPILVSRYASDVQKWRAQKKQFSKIEDLAKLENVPDVKEVLDNVKTQSQLLNNIQKAALNNNDDDAKHYQNLLLANQALSAFKNGATDNLLNLYESFAKDPSSKEKFGDDYMVKIQQAKKDIEALEKIYIQNSGAIQSDDLYNNRSSYYYGLQQASLQNFKVLNLAKELNNQIELLDIKDNADEISKLPISKEYLAETEKLNLYKQNLNDLNKEYEYLQTPEHVQKILNKKQESKVYEQEADLETQTQKEQSEKNYTNQPVTKSKNAEQENVLKEYEIYINNAQSLAEVNRIVDQMDKNNITIPADFYDKIILKKQSFPEVVEEEIDLTSTPTGPVTTTEPVSTTTPTDIKAKEAEIFSKIEAATKLGTIDQLVGGVNNDVSGAKGKTYRQFYTAELEALKGKPAEPIATQIVSEQIINTENQDLVSQTNLRTINYQDDNIENQTENNYNYERGIDKTINDLMIHLFDHYHDANIFKFKRNENGFPNYDNSSGVDIKTLNNVVQGDILTFKLVDLPLKALKSYEEYKARALAKGAVKTDFDDLHIGIYKDDKLIGFVRQPINISNTTNDPKLALTLKNNLIDFRKITISKLQKGETVNTKVTEKGTGNLYTKLNLDGTVNADINVIEQSRDKDLINNTNIFVFVGKDKMLKLPKTNFDSDIQSEIESRLLELSQLNLSPGKVFKLIKNLNNKWSLMPIYPGKINDAVADNILKVIDINSDVKVIIEKLNPYIYASQFKNANLIIREENKTVDFYIGTDKYNITDIRNNKIKRNAFKKQLLKVAQNIDVNNINNIYTQQEFEKNNTLMTNVYSFANEYFIQPYVEYEFTTLPFKPSLNEQRNAESIQPSTTQNEVETGKSIIDDADEYLNNAPEDALSTKIDTTNLNKVTFKRWLKTNLPQLTLSDIDNINDLQDTIVDSFGLFRDSTIYLFEGAGSLTAYHEAFHGVFRNLLTVAQREGLLNEAKTKYKQPTAEQLQKLQDNYKQKYTKEQLTNLYYEEQLADDFAIYADNQNNPNLLSRLTNSIKNFFNKILSFYSIFTNSDTKTIDKIFNSINTGKFAQVKTIAPDIVNRAIFSDYAYSDKPKQQLTFKDKLDAINSISDRFISLFQEGLSKQDSEYKKPSVIYSKIYKELIQARQKAIDENNKLQKGYISAVLVNFADLVNHDVKTNLKQRGIKVNEDISTISNLLDVEVKFIANDVAVELNNALDINQVQDYEINTLDSKTTKGLAEWTSIEGLSSASLRLKLFLSGIPIVTLNKKGNTEAIVDRLGLQKYYDFNSVYYSVENALVDKYTLADQLNELRRVAPYKPEIGQVLTKLETKSSNMDQDKFELLQNDFKSNFSKQQLVYTLIKFTFDAAKNKTTYEIIDANRETLTLQIKNQWLDAYKQPSKTLITSIESIFKKDVINPDALNKKLTSVGIQYSPAVIENIAKTKNPQFFSDLLAVLNWYQNENNFVFDKDTREAFNRLVNLEFVGSTKSYTSSFINGEGNNIYTIQLPSFISKKLAALKNPTKRNDLIQKYFQDAYYQDNNILNLFIKDNNFADIFKVSYLDSFKSEYGSKEGLVFTKLQPKDYVSAKIALYQNAAVNKQKIVKRSVHKYTYLTPSDKTMLPIIDSISYQVAINENGKDIDLTQSRELIDAFYNRFLSETKRINKTKDLINTIIETKDSSLLQELKQYYHVSSDDFIKNENNINDYIGKDELTDEDWKNISKILLKYNGQALQYNYFSESFNNKYKNKTTDFKNISPEAKLAVKNDIVKELASTYKDTLVEWTNLGILDFNPKTKLFSSTVIDLSNEKLNVLNLNDTDEQINDKLIRNLVASYSLNYQIHYMDLSDLFNGDIAQYKPNDLQKRTYQSQSFTVFGNFTNKIIRTIVKKDFKTSSNSLSDIENTLKFLGLEDYKIKSILNNYSNNNINVTDGQTFITPEFFKRIHVARGTWTPELQMAYDIAEGLEVGDIPSALTRLLTGFKPFYFGERFDPVTKTMIYEQVKCSMFPLFKSYLDINPLLAKRFEEMKTSESDMLTFESTFKGAIGYRSEITNDNYVTLDLDTDNFGIQVDNVDHSTDGNDSTRQFKMILPGSIDVNKTYNGTSGFEIRDTIMKMEAVNLEESLNELEANLTSKNNIEFNKYIQEMLTKGKVTENLIESLKIDVNGNFKYPLDNGILSTQIENLISSIYTNNAVKQLFVGGSLVQASSLGLKYKNLIEQQENLPEEVFDVQQELEYIKPNPETGEIGYAECAMPAHFKKFFNKKGFLKDIDNIPEELKQLIAYRIPTEGIHSMLAIKVTKFLPETLGNFILLPYEITMQFGADFDFDKIYFIGRDFYTDNNKMIPYTYVEGDTKEDQMNRYNQYFNYKTSKKEKYLSFNEFLELPIEKQNVRPARNNNIVNNYFKVLTSIESLPNLIKPSGFQALTDFKDWLDTTPSFKNKQKLKFFTDTAQNDFKERNHLGRILKGIWALHVSGHSYGVMMPLKISNYDPLDEKVILFDNNIKNTFNNIYDDNNDLIVDTIASIMAAVLDDIKNPLLKDLNITIETSNALAALLRSGETLENSLLFITQPAIVDYVNLIKQNRYALKKPGVYYNVDTVITSYVEQLNDAYEKTEKTDDDKEILASIKNNNINSLELAALHNNYYFKKTANENELYYNFKKASPTEKLQYYALQVKVLKQFKNADIIGSDFIDMNEFFAINKEVGPNYEDIIKKEDIFKNLSVGQNYSIKGFNIKDIPALEKTWKIHDAAKSFLSQHFPYATDLYLHIKNKVAKIQLNSTLSDLDVENRALINNFIRIYTDYDSDLFKDISNNKEQLFFVLPQIIRDIKNPDSKDKTIGNVSYEAINNNFFIKNLDVKNNVKLSDGTKLPFINLQANRLNPQVKDQLSDSFKLLFNNPNTNMLAIQLIKYSFLTTGFYKGVKTYSSLISPEILDSLGYTEYRKDLIQKLKTNSHNYSKPEVDNIIDLLIRNYPQKFTKIFDSSMFFENTNKGLPDILTTSKDKIMDHGRSRDMIFNEYNNSPKYITVRLVNNAEVSSKPQLYQRTGQFKYEKISPLGVEGFLIEADPNTENSILMNKGQGYDLESYSEFIEGINKPKLSVEAQKADTETVSSNIPTSDALNGDKSSTFTIEDKIKNTSKIDPNNNVTPC